MRWTGNHLYQRYIVAILVTTALMIWISVNEEGRGAIIPAQTAFWTAAVSAGWLQMILISRGVRSAFGQNRWPGWVLLLVAALVGAVPLSFEVRWLLDWIVAPPAGLPPPWLTYFNVSVINTVFSLVQYILIERWPLSDPAAKQDRPLSVSLHESHPFVQTLSDNIKQQNLHIEMDTDLQSMPQIDESDVTTNDGVKVGPNVTLLSRPPEGLTGEIQYLKMEDHYLSVHTDRGKGLTLHRMSDARRELLTADGLQVHKSWWVARSALSKVRKQGRRWMIETTDGTEIPVGRSFESSLRKAGWLRLKWRS